MYGDLLARVKRAVTYIRNVPDDKIRIAYKDVNLGVFIALSPDDNLVLHEAFRNAYHCGAENFKRVELQIRELDSPLVAKSRHSHTTLPGYENCKNDSHEKSITTSTATSQKQLRFECDPEAVVRND